LGQAHAGGGSGVPLDPNHQLAISSGLYTAAEAAAITTEGLEDFYHKYGIDFRNVTPDASGIRIIVMPTGGAAFALPGLSNLIDMANQVISDTSHPERAICHDWFNVDVTELVTFIDLPGSPFHDYIVPDDANNFLFKGKTVRSGDLFVYGEGNLLKNGADWSKSKNRETFKLRTTELSKQAINQDGNREFILNYDLADEDNNTIGLSLGATIITQVNGANFLQVRNVLTIDAPSE
jgi:hypothetical protein